MGEFVVPDWIPGRDVHAPTAGGRQQPPVECIRLAMAWQPGAVEDPRRSPDQFAVLGIAEPVTTAGASDGGARDYVAWHEAYDDPDSSLSKRLRAVRAEINRFLDNTAPRAVRVLSVCAGDGRDLLGVLARRPDRVRVGGTLVEIVPVLVDRAREAIVELEMGWRSRFGRPTLATAMRTPARRQQIC